MATKLPLVVGCCDFNRKFLLKNQYLEAIKISDKLIKIRAR